MFVSEGKSRLIMRKARAEVVAMFASGSPRAAVAKISRGGRSTPFYYCSKSIRFTLSPK